MLTAQRLWMRVAMALLWLCTLPSVGLAGKIADLAARLGRPLNVALHAQVSPSSGFVVGSVMTTTGLRNALMQRVDVGTVETFYPFEYQGLHDTEWDLVIIEGWFKSVNAFIHEVRRISAWRRSDAVAASGTKPPPQGTIILFWCLDPDFPGLGLLSRMDVDGFMTNSQGYRATLEAHAPTWFVPLAADAHEVHPPLVLRQQTPQAEPVDMEEDLTTYTDAVRGKLVYVGSAGALSVKENLEWMLLEAAASPSGLVIYGLGWDTHESLREHWRGVLPHKDGFLNAVYARAHGVIGVTMDAQRRHGMVNNRVFEALWSGAFLVSEHFEELEELLGDAVCYVRAPGDVRRCVEEKQQQQNHRGADAQGRGYTNHAKAVLQENHTYDRRVHFILERIVTNITWSYADQRRRRGKHHGRDRALRRSATALRSCGKTQDALQRTIVPCERALCSRLAVVFDCDAINEHTWAHYAASLGKAISHVSALHMYDVSFINAHQDLGAQAWGEGWARDAFEHVWVVGCTDGAAFRWVSSLADQTATNGGPLLRSWVPFPAHRCMHELKSSQGSGAVGRLLNLDTVYLSNELDRGTLAGHGVVHGLQYAYGVDHVALVGPEDEASPHQQHSCERIQGGDVVLLPANGASDRDPGARSLSEVVAEVVAWRGSSNVTAVAVADAVPRAWMEELLGGGDRRLLRCTCLGLGFGDTSSVCGGSAGGPACENVLHLQILGTEAWLGGALGHILRCASGAIVLPHDEEAGGDLEVSLLAMQRGGGGAQRREKEHNIVVRDTANKRLYNRAANGEFFNAATYGLDLLMGTTRALCLGRQGTSAAFTIQLHSHTLDQADLAYARHHFPIHAADSSPNRLWQPLAIHSLIIEPRLASFDVGRDGSWCLFANDHLVTCVLQADRVLRLSVTTPEAGGGADLYDVSFHVELKSTIFSDVIRRSEAVTLRLRNPGSSASGREATATVTEDPCGGREECLSYDYDLPLAVFGSAVVAVRERALEVVIQDERSQDQTAFLAHAHGDDVAAVARDFVDAYGLAGKAGGGCVPGDARCATGQVLRALGVEVGVGLEGAGAGLEGAEEEEGVAGEDEFAHRVAASLKMKLRDMVSRESRGGGARAREGGG